MSKNFLYVGLFIVFGAAFVIACVLFSKILSFILGYRNPTETKLKPYECGEIPVESAWRKFTPRFYIIALIFIIFDVEIIFMIPWACYFSSLLEQGLAVFAAIEMLVFIIILLLGFAYLWSEGDLDWIKGYQPSSSSKEKQEKYHLVK
ncbi:MAG: NADH-quinone oxidoreductase subunit A [Candidatus Hydrogenedentota bacterium]